MLITFKSKAAPDVMMYEQHAKRILDLLHKDVQRGVITVAELEPALERLEAVLGESRNQMPAEGLHHEHSKHPGEAGTDDPAHADYVSFATRSYPLLAMLRAAKKSGVSVIWGF